jgi:hypothetical protein
MLMKKILPAAALLALLGFSCNSPAKKPDEPSTKAMENEIDRKNTPPDSMEQDHTAVNDSNKTGHSNSGNIGGK